MKGLNVPTHLKQFRGKNCQDIPEAKAAGPALQDRTECSGWTLSAKPLLIKLLIGFLRHCPRVFGNKASQSVTRHLACPPRTQPPPGLGLRWGRESSGVEGKRKRKDCPITELTETNDFSQL